VILDIECAWSREPGWFQTLDAKQQTRLLSWWRIKHEHHQE